MAFGWVRVVAGVGGTRLELWGGVHPRVRGLGIGAELLDRQLAAAARARDRLAGAGPARVVLHCLGSQPELAHLARARGLVQRRTFVDLALATPAPPPPCDAPAGVRLVRWDPSLDEAVRIAHNEAFADHWGSEPADRARWRAESTGHRSFRPDLSSIALVAEPPAGQPQDRGAPGERQAPLVAGYLLAGAFPADWPTAGRPQAWVQTLGVRPAWRRRGVGAALLTAALAAMAGAGDGFAEALVGVDEANPTGALRLYRRHGFAPVRRVGLFEGPVPATSRGRR